MVEGTDVNIEADGAPWQPNAGAERVATWHYYDIPLAGVVRVGGDRYVFRCEAGHTEEVSIWSYRPITVAAQELLESLPNGESFSMVFEWFCAAVHPVAHALWEEEGPTGVLTPLRRCYECGEPILHTQEFQTHGRAGPVHVACLSS